MKRVGNVFLRILAILGILFLCFISAFSFLVFDDTKFLGVIFLGSGVWGVLEMSGVVPRSPFGEKDFHRNVGTFGAFIVGIYFLLR
jgi:hypothetical protein